MKKIVLAAGGTGGHIFPALAVARSLKIKDSSVDLLWIGTERSREREVCEKNNIPVMMLNVSGINRKKPFSAISSLLKMSISIVKVYLDFLKREPDTVIAFGGYVCMPVLLAAKLRKIPVFIQEQNSVPGLVNRLMSGYAKKSFLGLPLDEDRSLKGETLLTGNPVRDKDRSYDSLADTVGLKNNKKSILICGGSQGAASMNRKLVNSVKLLSEEGYQIIWQSGDVSYIEIKREFENNENVKIFETFEDLYPIYYNVDIIIGRSGASTLAEAALFNLPIVMIPLPWSAEDHQKKNASLIEKQGWGVVVVQDENCSQKVYEEVKNILNNGYEKMVTAARRNSPATAADEIVKEIYLEINR